MLFHLFINYVIIIRSIYYLKDYFNSEFATCLRRRYPFLTASAAAAAPVASGSWQGRICSWLCCWPPSACEWVEGRDEGQVVQSVVHADAVFVGHLETGSHAPTVALPKDVVNVLTGVTTLKLKSVGILCTFYRCSHKRKHSRAKWKLPWDTIFPRTWCTWQTVWG